GGWQMGGEGGEAGGVWQEVFRRAYGAGEGRGTGGPVLLGGAACAALDRLRSRPPGLGPELGPAARLRAALGRLPRVEAAAFALWYFHDPSRPQIADGLALRR